MRRSIPRPAAHCIYGLTTCLAPTHCPAMNGATNNTPSATTSLAPYQGSDVNTIDAMINIAAPAANFRLLDLGCGDGRILIRALTHHSCAAAVGVEASLDIKQLADAHVTASLEPERRRQFKVVLGDALDEAISLAEFDVVTMFLLPVGLAAIGPRIT